MDATRIHLFITHLPVFGLIIGIFALGFGLLRRDKPTKTISLAIIIVAIAGGLIAFQSGEPAEERVKTVTGVSKEAIELHEESAELTNLFLIGLGLLSATSLYLEIKGNRFAPKLLLLVLAFSAATLYFAARTASLGGKIRHTEISHPN